MLKLRTAIDHSMCPGWRSAYLITLSLGEKRGTSSPRAGAVIMMSMASTFVLTAIEFDVIGNREVQKILE